MRRLAIATAAILAAVALYALATLPPQPLRMSLDRVDPALAARTVRGAYHVHTSRSDGAEGKAAIAAAAARASLQFVIFTDHGDASRPPDAPAYIDGVLCIDAVEISTDGGHYVALGLAQAPYPLGGEARAVVEDVERLGGFGIVAHPDHPRGQLAWGDWSLPVDGLEWINADAEWRTEGLLAVARVAFHYLLRPAPAIASVLDRPVETLRRWDEMNRTRLVVGLAAVDAHGGGGGTDGDEPRVAIGPNYDASFRTVTNRVVLSAPWTGDAIADADRLLGAIRAGLVYSVVDGLSPDVLLSMDGAPAVRSPLPAGSESSTVTSGNASRLEIHLERAPGEPPVPWVLTNWTGTPTELTSLPLAPSGDTAEAMAPGPWRVEHAPGSSGQIELGQDGFSLQYQLQDGERSSQFVAAASDLSGEAFGGLFFEAASDRPMRVSVQLRYPPDDYRWVRSVYLDATTRTIFVPVGEMMAAEASKGTPPPAGLARSLLFVVDLVNARPGDAGRFSVRDLRTVPPAGR